METIEGNKLIADTGIILKDSPQAAEYRTNISGWVSAKGHFYGKDEELARYDGSTHKKCETCENVYVKEWNYAICQSCLDSKRFSDYLKREEIPYSSDMVVVIRDSDTYFFSEEDLIDYLVDNENEFGHIYLDVCDPQYLSAIDPHSQWEDVIPIDTDFGSIASDELISALLHLNKIISNHNPVSWYPGKKRTTYEFLPEKNQLNRWRQ